MSEQTKQHVPFLGTEVAEPSFDKASVAILPVPFEATVCWGRGTADGPAAILAASPHLEFYDEQMKLEPYKSGIWTADPLALPEEPGEEVVRIIARRFGELMDAGKWVVMLGGEHAITPGGVRAAAERFEGLRIVQFDAHADLREAYGGTAWSHACAMARCRELAPIQAIGIRSYTREEADLIEAGIPGYRITHAWEMLASDAVDRALEGIDGQPVYLTFDLDFFDPSIIPATGTPEPGGGDWWSTLRLLEGLFERANVVACDVVELAPHPGLEHADFTAARLVHKLIGMHCGGRSSAG
jgi:agmatinase